MVCVCIVLVLLACCFVLCGVFCFDFGCLGLGLPLIGNLVSLYNLLYWLLWWVWWVLLSAV